MQALLSYIIGRKLQALSTGAAVICIEIGTLLTDSLGVQMRASLLSPHQDFAFDYFKTLLHSFFLIGALFLLIHFD